MGPTQRSGPPRHTESRPQEVTTKTTASVQLATDKLPDVWASALAPGPGRRLWVISYRCVHCGFPHLGRARTFERLMGVRRARCGRRVWVIVARVYVGGSVEKV